VFAVPHNCHVFADTVLQAELMDVGGQVLAECIGYIL
jgi:hypothetical protein